MSNAHFAPAEWTIIDVCDIRATDEAGMGGEDAPARRCACCWARVCVLVAVMHKVTGDEAILGTSCARRTAFGPIPSTRKAGTPKPSRPMPRNHARALQALTLAWGAVAEHVVAEQSAAAAPFVSGEIGDVDLLAMLAAMEAIAPC